MPLSNLGVPSGRLVHFQSARGDSQKRQAGSKVSHIGVCTNRTCKRQGSMQVQHISYVCCRRCNHGIESVKSVPCVQILKVLEDLELGDGLGISVRSSGCLGNCGSGPNVSLDTGTVLQSVGTVAVAFKVLKEFCDYEVPEDVKQCIQVWLPGYCL